MALLVALIAAAVLYMAFETVGFETLVAVALAGIIGALFGTTFLDRSLR